ncbi:Acyl-CoA dehydrogenase fadE12 [Frankia canadensis]|uniref:Acyl-CoA dehydrogenase fadE12 n=1 Tax=Frankia canadensis TaxID=1836972 RepID=A0A2I2KY41_9ACTN|nr:acyl-CoA dehydrogenase family protein [Frankia canadensis]SNQ50578.1 Acyl-CoA dehydrogenase fadE12 [Frankia canadensis]SOU57868.1 Acyl-CoA dehydrogenase fadE12 [Frankia canadensis]
MTITSAGRVDRTAVLPLEPTEEERVLRSTVSDIVGRFGHSYYMERSRSGEPMRELWELLGKSGFLGLNIPEEYGGGGAGLTELAIVLEELSARGCPELAMVLSQGIAGSILPLHGSAEQKARYLPGIASGAEKFVFALTEPDAGSNSHNVTTSAQLDGDEWVIRGTKYYISGVDHCDHFLLVARTGTNEATGRGRLTLFIVDDPNIAGLERQPIPTALQAPERQFTLFFDGVRLPADAVVGEVGHGLRPLFDGLNPERVLSAVICTGVARYALDRAVAYTTQRQVWGVPIAAHQGVQHPLAEAAIELEAARGMVWRAAALFDAGRPAGEEANMAKFLASRAGLKALDTAIQMHGGNGLADEYGLADLWGIVRLQQIAPVSTQMVLNHIAQHTLGLPRSY